MLGLQRNLESSKGGLVTANPLAKVDILVVLYDQSELDEKMSKVPIVVQ